MRSMENGEKTFADFVGSVRTTLDRLLTILDNRKFPKSEFRQTSLAYLGRSVSAFDAIVLLCERRYGPEAFILARSLFEDAVRFRWLRKDPKGRGGLLAAKVSFEADKAVRALERVLTDLPLLDSMVPPQYREEVHREWSATKAHLKKAGTRMPSVLDMAAEG